MKTKTLSALAEGQRYFVDVSGAGRDASSVANRVVDSAAPSIQIAQRRCAACDREARVHVLRGYQQGNAIAEHLCFDCLRAAPVRTPLVESAPERRLRPADFLNLTGAGIIAFALSSDWLLPSGIGGFGAYQFGGLLLGIFIAFLGAVLRSEIIALAGVAAGLGSALADVLDLHHNAGFGWRQAAAALLGLLIVVLGLLVRARSRQQSGGSERPKPNHAQPRPATALSEGLD